PPSFIKSLRFRKISEAFLFSHCFFFCFIFFPQISQMHTDFSSALPFYLFPTDFTDAHRFLFFVDEKDFVRNLFCFSLV
uniref:hypothetical protein n=1 Tax=Prevotella sp. TaxID=59823 RepID=UPI0040272D70